MAPQNYYSNFHMVLNRQDGFWAISYPLKVKPTVMRVREGLGNVTAFPTLSFQTRFPLHDRKLQGGRIQILCLSGIDMEKQDRLCGVLVHPCCHLAFPSPLEAGLSKELCYRWHLCTYNPPITQGNANTKQDLILLVVTPMHASFERHMLCREGLFSKSHIELQYLDVIYNHGLVPAILYFMLKLHISLKG